MKPLLRTRQGLRPPVAASEVIFLAYAFASLAAISCCLVAMAIAGPSVVLAHWDASDTVLALYAGAICSALNYFLITWASARLAASVCALYACVQTPGTVVFALVMRKEVPTWTG